MFRTSWKLLCLAGGEKSATPLLAPSPLIDIFLHNLSCDLPKGPEGLELGRGEGGNACLDFLSLAPFSREPRLPSAGAVPRLPPLVLLTHISKAKPGPLLYTYIKTLEVHSSQPGRRTEVWGGGIQGVRGLTPAGFIWKTASTGCLSRLSGISLTSAGRRTNLFCSFYFCEQQEIPGADFTSFVINYVQMYWPSSWEVNTHRPWKSESWRDTI